MLNFKFSLHNTARVMTLDTCLKEWMMVPPKNVGVLAGLKSLQPTNRGFQQRSARWVILLTRK